MTADLDVAAGVAYVASPYSSPDAAVREGRYQAALDFVIWCMGRGLRVFSPIVYCHPMALRGGLPTDASFWWEFNRSMLAGCDRMFFLKLPGFESSLGMRQEMDEALGRDGFNVILFEPNAEAGYSPALRLFGGRE